MIECEHCEIWYHIHCLGISPAKSKAYTADGADFTCFRCCAKRGEKFPFDPRVKEPLVKQLPTSKCAALQLKKAEKLGLKVPTAAALGEAGWMRLVRRGWLTTAGTFSRRCTRQS